MKRFDGIYKRAKVEHPAYWGESLTAIRHLIGEHTEYTVGSGYNHIVKGTVKWLTP